MSILSFYLAFFLLSLLFELALKFLNLQELRKNYREPPAIFKGVIDPETYNKSLRYTAERTRFGIFSQLYSAALVLLFLPGGWLGALESRVSALFPGPYCSGIVFVLTVALIFSVLEMPLSLYSTFVIEERFGFNRSSLALWLKDLCKSYLLSLALALPLLGGLFYFMHSAGNLWWLYAFFFISGFQLFLTFVYPIWIAPLFNRFTALEEGELKEHITKLAERLGFRTSGIFVMDGSRRSAHANAYFTGLGSRKRVVLFDTLIRELEREELLAVLAHEIGHEKKQHVKKGLALSLALTFVSLWLLNVLLTCEPLYAAFGFRGESYHSALIIFALASGPFTYFLTPFFNLLSRHHEYQADSFAAKALGNPQPMIHGLLALAKKSLSNLTPHPWYSFFHYSHPGLKERIAALEK